MKHFFAFVLWFSIASIAKAEIIQVHAEDTNNFSRLSFVFSEPVSWRLEQEGKRYNIIFDEISDTIDVSDISNKTTDTRIGNVTVSKNNRKVGFDVTCDCDVHGFQLRPGFVTVKIIGPKGVPTRTVEAEPSDGENRTDSLVPEPPISIPIPPTRTSPRVGVFADQQTKPEKQHTLIGVAEVDDRTSEIRGQLLQQLSKAASQGLLDIKTQPPLQTIEAPSENVHEQPQEEHDAQVESVPRSNIHIETSVDRAASDRRTAPKHLKQDVVCIPDAVLDVVSWGDPKAVYNRITIERGNIVQEFDRVDRSALTRFIQANLYAGFGIEAIVAQTSFGEESAHVDVLTGIAKIVDGAKSGQNNVFENQIGCEGRSALWAAFSLNTLSGQSFINRKAIIRNFAELPGHLRKHLGPNLSRKFVDIGDEKTARTLRNAIVRASGNPTSEMKLLEAHLNQERGLESESHTILQEVVNDDGASSIVALITIFENLTSVHDAVDSKLISNAQAMVYEQQDTENGAKLQALLVIALAQENLFPEARKRLISLQRLDRVSSGKVDGLWADVLQEATQNAPTEDFLQFVYASRAELLERKIPQKTRLSAAQRLIAEGFPEMAEALMLISGAPKENEAIALAKIAIANHHPEQAIAIIENITSDSAMRLRAQSYLMLGETAKAAEDYENLSDQEGVSTTLWQAGDWQRIERDGLGVEKDAAGLMHQNLDLQSKGLITRSKSYLEESQRAQEVLDALLNKFGPVES